MGILGGSGRAFVHAASVKMDLWVPWCVAGCQLQTIDFLTYIYATVDAKCVVSRAISDVLYAWRSHLQSPMKCPSTSMGILK